MSIYRYTVKLGNSDPMYGNTKVLKEFGEDKEGALSWANANGQILGVNPDHVYVEEAEFVNEENLRKGISLYCRPIWSGAFHGYHEEKKGNIDTLIAGAKEDQKQGASPREKKKNDREMSL